MSKKTKNSNVEPKIIHEPTVSWGFGYALAEDKPNVIIGRIITNIEILGLSEKQEKPLKDLLRQAVWDVFNEAVVLSPETHTQLREKHYKEYDIARRNNAVPRAV